MHIEVVCLKELLEWAYSEMLLFNLLQQRVDCYRLLHHLQYARVRTHWYYLVRSEQQGQVLQLKNVVKLVYKLQGELLLLQVVSCFDHYMHQIPRLQVGVYWLRFDPLPHLLLFLPKYQFQLVPIVNLLPITLSTDISCSFHWVWEVEQFVGDKFRFRMT